MRNRYPGECIVCQKHLGPEEGHYEKIKGQGAILCQDHYEQHFRPRVKIVMRGGKPFVAPDGYLGEAFGLYTDTTKATGCKYDPASRGNVCDSGSVAKVIVALQKSGFLIDVSDEVKSFLGEKTEQIRHDISSATSRLDATDDLLAKRGLSLYGYQREGIVWLAGRDKALLGDAPGVGKTAQALIALPAQSPVVVVCPAVVKGVWTQEAQKWRPDISHVTALKGRGSFRWAGQDEIVITNYAILPVPQTFGEKPSPGDPIPKCPPGTVLICDEAHALKDPKSKQTRAFRGLARLVLSQGGRVWLLTGTPLVNRPPELWSVLGSADLAKESFSDWNTFVRLFNGSPGKWGGHDWGRPTQESADRLKRVMLRRTKEDVLKQLPPKTYQTIPVEIDKKYISEINKILKESGKTADEVLKAIETALANNKVPAFEQMSRISEALSRAKFAALSEIVDQYEDAGEPVLVFETHLWPLRELVKLRDKPKNKGWGLITGADTPTEKRTKIVSDFQAGKLAGVALTIKAGGVGITLHKAKTAIFGSSSWSPADNEQAEDRVHRVGQDRGVTIIRLVATHPLDQRVMELLDKKRGIIQGSVGRAETKPGEVTSDPTAPLVAAIEAASRQQKQIASTDELISKSRQRQRSATASGPVKSTAEQNAPHPPRTRREQWVADGLVDLSALDPDNALQKNDEGFNRNDGDFGHSLARKISFDGQLTPRQWVFAIKMLSKYTRQIGDMPSAVADDYAIVNPVCVS